MVERFECNKLYVNSNRADRIVKCEFITNNGKAVLTHVCKNPDFTGAHSIVPYTDVLSSSPENWDEFNLPEIPGETMWGISFTTTNRRRGMLDRLYPSEAEAVAYTTRPTANLDRDYQIHPIIIRAIQTLEEFVRSVENEEETI